MRKDRQEKLSRREFGKVAVTAAGLSLVPGLARTRAPQQEPPAGKESKPTESSPAPSAEALALAAIVKLRYGARLNDDAMKEITRSLDGGLRSAAALRKVPLENSDEPAFVFRAWRGDRA